MRPPPSAATSTSRCSSDMDSRKVIYVEPRVAASQGAAADNASDPRPQANVTATAIRVNDPDQPTFRYANPLACSSATVATPDGTNFMYDASFASCKSSFWS